MKPNRFDRAAVAIGIGALACLLFAIVEGSQKVNSFVYIDYRDGVIGMWVLLALGVVAVLGGLARIRLIVLLSGLGFLGGALLQLIQWPSGQTLLGGDGSVISLFGGLGLGLVVVALAPRDPRDDGPDDAPPHQQPQYGGSHPQQPTTPLRHPAAPPQGTPGSPPAGQPPGNERSQRWT